MPAEAVHLSALEDALLAWRGMPVDPAARLGAIFVDLPYFDRLPLAIARYLFRFRPAPSLWGDTFHQVAPIAVGRQLAQQAFALAQNASTRDEGTWLSSFALGYICHAAVDRSIHPLVNALAEKRARQFSDSPLRQHQEVEKFQSILFHEERFGRDFMGTSELLKHIAIDASGLFRPVVWNSVSQALVNAAGAAPEEALTRRWARGYLNYVRILGSPLGKTIAPASRKARERLWAYDEVHFTEVFSAAVKTSAQWLQTLSDYQRSGDFSSSAVAELEKTIPEGTIDPGPETRPPQTTEPRTTSTLPT